MEMITEERNATQTAAAGKEDLSLMWTLYRSDMEASQQESDRIREDYARLYEAMSGKSLEEMDAILDPVTLLCADHEFEGFVRGMRMGIRMARELAY